MDKLKDKLKTLMNVHYLTNIFLAANYFILKTIPYVCEYLFESCVFEWREMEILMLLVIFIAVKTRRAATWLQFVNTMCTFSKAANIILYWREGQIHVILFSLACFLHFVFLPQPIYKGPQNIQYLRGGHLENEIKRDDRITWLVCFYATWSPPCADFTPVFAEISNKFGGLNNLKFAKFDCNLYPDVAQNYNVSTSPLSKQLPTVILYQKGVETKRRPFVDSKNSVYKFIFSLDNVIKEFDLNKIYYECKNNQIAIKPINKTKTENKEVEETLSPQEKKDI
jgi:thiol-disulfide isomerase/thioredoxin